MLRTTQAPYKKVTIRDASSGATHVHAARPVPASLGGLNVVNTQSAPVWLQVFDKAAASVVLGTTMPDQEFQIGPDADWPYKPPNLLPGDVSYDISISVAVTVGEAASAGGATPVAAGVHVTVLYRATLSMG